MSRTRQGEYLLKRYPDGMTLPSRNFFVIDPDVHTDKVKDMQVVAEQCVTLCMLDADNDFFLYYPFDPERTAKRQLSPPLLTEGGIEPLAFADGSRGTFAYCRRTLAVAYPDRLKLFAIDSDDVITLDVRVKMLTAGKERFLVALEDAPQLLVVTVEGSVIGTIDIDGELVAMTDGEQPHLLTRKNGELFFDGEACPAVEVPITDIALQADGGLLLGHSDAEAGIRLNGPEAKELVYKMAVLRMGIDCAGSLWVLNDRGEMRRFLPEPYYEPSLSEPLTLLFDSFKADTRWSTLKLDYELPEGSSVTVRIESAPCVKPGCATPGDAPVVREYRDVTEILLCGMCGATLKVTLNLLSDSVRRRTPVLHTVRAEFDVKSYVDYLPACYRDCNEESLERYLAMFRSGMERVESKIDNSAEMIDPLRTDASLLEWLSGWLGLARDTRWPEAKWRVFLKRAPALYAGLGTPAAMSEAIAIYCGEPPGSIEENVVIDGELRPFGFCVRMKPELLLEARDIEVIESIIRAFKPAHTQGRLYVDRRLSEKREFVVGESVLPYNTEIQ